ncbi:hypothetical protein [Vibrio sp. 10N.261.55.A7]|uniref:hypothetical protein n=1 Tax=Vibrio sp. 10N.261.55.A7 TaxID=1880851 RepID=UPI000C82C0F5|nr:hypothetical protein [Vibrio sp. 10N.261.55.A7]PMK03217.1 hypothetical protein BCU12_17520 [Vibrio sp. 10N.261.55.A7]
MNNLNSVLISALVLSLVGCGGGGGGEGSSTATPAAASPASSETAASESFVETVVQRSMSELSIPDGFSFNPIKDHSFDVDISNFSTQRAYVSVYGEYSEDSDGTIQANYSSRIASSALSSGVAELNFCIADSQQMLLAEIWFYDGTDPLQVVIPASQTDWTL